MTRNVITAILLLVSVSGFAQVQTQVIGDSVKIKSNTGPGELILENSTKNTKGFLYNRGNGRTEFRRGILRINDSVYVIGGDTLNLNTYASSNSWKITGNAGTNPTSNFLGTTDSNTLVVRTNNKQRLSVWADGTVNIAASDTTKRPLFRIYPNGDFAASSTNNYTANQVYRETGLRFHRALGILEIGTSNKLDTSLQQSQGRFGTSAIVVNSDSFNTIKGTLISSIIAGDGITIDSTAQVNWSLVNGEQHWIRTNLAKTNVFGYGHYMLGRSAVGSLITGISHRIDSLNNSSLITGFNHFDLDSSYFCLVNGFQNQFSGRAQFLSGGNLISQGFASTTLGLSNVHFTSLPPGGKIVKPNDLKGYPIFVIGNGNSVISTGPRSNALTILYTGRTQINTTGHDSALTETDVTPKAALEVVSKNSGVLLPKLTTAQRDNILSGDRHNGLLLYNTDSSRFQFYDGSIWKTIGDNGSSAGNAYAIQALADDDTIIWNGTSGDNSSVLLEGANRTLSIANPVQGHTYRIKIKQDNTGNKTITNWPASVLWPAGNPPVLSTVAGSMDMVTLYYDGTNFFGDYKMLYKASTYDLDAQKYFDSVATTGSLTLTEKNAWNNFVLAAKSGTNYWGNIAVINPVLGATSAEHAWNAKNPSTFKATYSGTITHTANHMVSNGTTGYVNSHFNMNTNDGDGLATIAIWVRNNVDAVAVAMGAISATNRYTQIYPRFGNTFYGQVNNNNSISEAVTVSTSVGLSLATRLTSTGTYIQRNATQTGGTSSSLITNNDIYVLAQNSNGSAANFSTYQVCMYMIATTPFTTAQASQFYTDFSTFITAVGR